MNTIRRYCLPLGLLALLVIATPSFAAAKTWKGWITDSKCGAKGASAAALACTQKCIAAGAHPVFVVDGSQAVLTISDPASVADHIGRHVQVSGKLDAKDHVITIRRVKMLAQ